jgi:hypothetical protein
MQPIGDQITLQNLPRLTGLKDEWNNGGAGNRIQRAATHMKTPLHLQQPKYQPTNIFQSIQNCDDVRVVTELTLDFVEASEDQTLMRTNERQAVLETGLRKLVELCSKQSCNQMRWIGEHNEDMTCDLYLLRRILTNVEQQSMCFDNDGIDPTTIEESNEQSNEQSKEQETTEEFVFHQSQGKGGSSQNRACEVACNGLQFLWTMLRPTTGENAQEKEKRRIVYRDAFFNCRCVEVLVCVMQEQGCCNYVLCNKKHISCKVAEYGISCLHSLVVGSPGNTGYALTLGALETVEKCFNVHGRVSPRLRKAAASTLLILRTMKNDPAYKLEAEAQRLKIIAEQPGATTKDRVAAAKAAAKVQVVRMG